MWLAIFPVPSSVCFVGLDVGVRALTCTDFLHGVTIPFSEEGAPFLNLRLEEKIDSIKVC